MPADERVTVGLVRGLHGLKGAVRVEVLSDDPERFAIGAELYLEGEERPLTVVWAGPSKPGLLLRFAEFSSREAVEPLRDRYLEAIVGAPLPEGSWYWHQIQGLAARTTDGRDLGTVVDVFRAGGGEVYVAKGGPLGEVMIPGVANVVVELDPVGGKLVVDPVALDLSDKPPRRRRRHAVPPSQRRKTSGGKKQPVPRDADTPDPKDAETAESSGVETPDPSDADMTEPNGAEKAEANEAG